MSGLYRTIHEQIEALWNAGWTHADVPVVWRANAPDSRPDPGLTPHFLRNEVQFGRETIIAYGGGPGRNFRALFGSVLFYIFSARAEQDEDTGLDLMADAVAIYRSQRVGDLSFIGDHSGFDVGPDQQPLEDGNWFVRGAMVVFQYRFQG